MESQEDLNLELVACDALNTTETAAFLEKVHLPIGGCFLMPLVLRDALFLQQTQNAFDLVRQSKVEAFDVLSSLCDVKVMDFFVAFSSVTALWGNVGQSNYARYISSLSLHVFWSLIHHTVLVLLSVEEYPSIRMLSPFSSPPY